jgi:hypothetical protein
MCPFYIEDVKQFVENHWEKLVGATRVLQVKRSVLKSRILRVIAKVYTVGKALVKGLREILLNL